MRVSWLMRFSLALLLLLGFNLPTHAFESCQEAITYFQAQDPNYTLCNQGPYGDGYVCEIGTSYYPPETGCAYPIVQTHYIQCALSKVLNQSTGTCACPAGTSWSTSANSCVTNCSYPKVMINGQCVDPPSSCQYPFQEDGNGGCKCSGDLVKVGESCIKPDCSKKQQTCSTSCGGLNGDMSGVAYFYCESATDTDTSTVIFSDDTYKCECATTTPGCPTGQIGITSSVTGAITCGDPKNPGCPTGSYFGEFNGKKDCIKPGDNNDPDETPNNCIQGMGGVYFGSTLYCVPPKDTTSCPTGTTSFITDTGLKICKGTDTQGNPTGDSPDTNGSIKGTPTSGSGTGTGTGTGGSGTGTDTSGIEAKLSEIKNNTDTMKASETQTANNTSTIADALTGSASTVGQGSFAASTAAIQAQVETLKAQYGSTLTTVKNQMTGFLSTVAAPTGIGGLPCYDAVRIPVLNIDFSLCFTRFEEALRVIGNYIYGIAFLLAGLIILGSSRSEG